jgi:hypothetical protein
MASLLIKSMNKKFKNKKKVKLVLVQFEYFIDLKDTKKK